MECQIQIDYTILFPLNRGEIKDFMPNQLETWLWNTHLQC